VWQGRFIAAKKRGKWEYVSRTRNISAAVILAIHEGQVILVEQYRVPIGAYCLELPAGLIGDDEEGEDVELAAIRELEEEAGYRAERMVDLGRFYASSGMSAEGFTLLRAEGLIRVGDGGGGRGRGYRRPPRAGGADCQLRRGQARGGVRDGRQAAAAAGRRHAGGLIACVVRQGSATNSGTRSAPGRGRLVGRSSLLLLIVQIQQGSVGL
jgi:ADP-ribose pyrophosphatase